MLNKNLDLFERAIKNASFCLLFLWLFSCVNADKVPFTVKANLFDQEEPDSLGLSMAIGTETHTIFQPRDTTDHFSNGAVIIGFKNWLYCMWQSSKTDEDSKDTWVAYSRSKDGIIWSNPKVLAETITDGYCTSGGWWVNKDTLVAYINTWPDSVVPKGGYTQFKTSIDGSKWSNLKALKMAGGDTLNGIFEQDPHALSNGRIINAAHFQPGMKVTPIYTDDKSGVRAWKRANFSSLSSGDVSREIEPSWYLRNDGALVMVFRDQESTFKKLASMSTDKGESWSRPVVTDMPDSRSKQSAGNIGDMAFFVNNPVNNKNRFPLVITLSKDGLNFNKAFVLRKGGKGIQKLRYEGRAKRLGFHYPKSTIWKGHLYVSYTTNKEDVEYTRVPLSSLIIDDE